MQYHSTRSRDDLCGSRAAVLQGLCEDGGLFVSDELPGAAFDMRPLMDMEYNDIVLEVFRRVLSDYTGEELSDCIRKAYEGRFEGGCPAPVSRIGEDFLLELWHGPTCAFKDVALCMLPQLMSKALKGKQEKIMILTSTSGDTGKAALSGFRNTDGIGITVFYPHQLVSDIQYLQMVTDDGIHSKVCAVRGNFDDCQTSMKQIFEKCSAHIRETYGVRLSSANSINVGRLVPQIVYYIYAYARLVKEGRVAFGEKVDFIVPTGNFGDILAGYYEKLLGLPVGMLTVASNSNNVLTDFLETGVYDKNREFYRTMSPSMDILVSSNLERLLYYASGCSCEVVGGLMKDLKETGRFTVPEEMHKVIRESFDCGFADEEETLSAIRAAWEKHGRLLDTHTAVAYSVLEKLRTEGKKDRSVPTVILSTASPFKFAEDVFAAVSGRTDGKKGMEALSELAAFTGEKVPGPLAELGEKPLIHAGNVVERGEMAAFAEAFCKEFSKEA